MRAKIKPHGRHLRRLNPAAWCTDTGKNREKTRMAISKLIDPNPNGFIQHDHNHNGIDRSHGEVSPTLVLRWFSRRM
jgi:hypothetical protein